MTYWGYHLMLDCGGADAAAIDDHDNIYNFVKELVVAIDMVAYGEPQIERFAEHDLTKAGYSMCQMIQTSNICAHFVPHYGQMYLDVFSCKTFDIDTVVEVTKKYFKFGTVRVNYLTRNAD